MCCEHKCKNCKKELVYDIKHKRYPIFCSKECRSEYGKNRNIHYCEVCGKLAKYDEKFKTWRKTCGGLECLKEEHRKAQQLGVSNRVKLNITKEELYEIFITQNKSRTETAKYFNCSEANIKKMCRIYGIVKNQKEALKNTCNTKLEKYGYQYYTNNDVISKTEIEWLNSLGIPNDSKHRQVVLGESRVDGFNPETNTVYEFLGDYWHGNPKLFNSNETNKHNDLTMGELYTETIDRFNKLKSLGYNIVYIWESQYKKGEGFSVFNQ